MQDPYSMDALRLDIESWRQSQPSIMVTERKRKCRMNSVTLMMRRLVTITKQEGQMPSVRQVAATVHHYSAAKKLSPDQQLNVFVKMCEALSRL